MATVDAVGFRVVVALAWTGPPVLAAASLRPPVGPSGSVSVSARPTGQPVRDRLLDVLYFLEHLTRTQLLTVLENGLKKYVQFANVKEAVGAAL